MKDQIFKFCAMLLIPLMAVINCPVGSFAAEEGTPVEIKIKHAPVEQVVAGERIPIEAKVTAESGAEVVRVYFKAIDAEAYSFVPMTAFKDDSIKGTLFSGTSFRGTLPAAANGAGSFNYLILVKNGENQVVKSQTYNVTVQDNDDAEQAVAGNEQIEVYTELKEAPAEITGFSDNIAIDVVESAAKLGVVAGIYSAATAGSSTSGAVAGGTVPSSLGLSTTAIVAGAAVATVAVVGGIAASSGGGSSDSAQELTSNTILGTWNVREVVPNGAEQTFRLTFNNNGRYSTSASFPGSWNLSGNTLTMRPDHTSSTWTGTVSGNSQSFVMRGSTTVYFTR